jgi:hypothetical protein
MKVRKLSVGAVFALGICGLSPLAAASMPSNPLSDPNFLVLPNGKNLRTVKVSGVALSLTRGTGATFGPSAQTAYEKLKTETLVAGEHPVQPTENSSAPPSRKSSWRELCSTNRAASLPPTSCS